MAKNDETYVIVKAPNGSILEVPENIVENGHNLFFSSEKGEISIFIMCDGKINSDYK
jgi:hypothetical protein